MPEFTPFPKIARLNREVVVTEKIDGSNGAIIIPEPDGPDVDGVERASHVWAQSRKRVIEPTKQGDNFGFAHWVRDNAEALADVLGPGVHFGEWYGSGIGRGYGLTRGERYFALFNTSRWCGEDLEPLPELARVSHLTTTPVLAVASTPCGGVVDGAEASLREHGSQAAGAIGFERPEGVVVYHTQGNVMFKVTLEGDDAGKEWGA